MTGFRDSGGGAGANSHHLWNSVASAGMPYQSRPQPAVGDREAQVGEGFLPWHVALTLSPVRVLKKQEISGHWEERHSFA